MGRIFFNFFFLVLEGPLSEDTHPSTPHWINPAVHHQIFFKPNFFDISSTPPLFFRVFFFFFFHIL